MQLTDYIEDMQLPRSGLWWGPSSLATVNAMPWSPISQTRRHMRISYTVNSCVMSQHSSYRRNIKTGSKPFYRSFVHSLSRAHISERIPDPDSNSDPNQPRVHLLYWQGGSTHVTWDSVDQYFSVRHRVQGLTRSFRRPEIWAPISHRQAVSKSSVAEV
jgi:hypothetical protein